MSNNLASRTGITQVVIRQLNQKKNIIYFNLELLSKEVIENFILLYVTPPFC